MAVPFKYNFAVVSMIPSSYKDSHPSVDLNKARQNLEAYIEVLRKLGIDVLELPPNEKHPESVNVDDCAVVINGTALMCCPPTERQGEVNVMRQTLRRELGLAIAEILDAKALLEGGDVLFTGKEIFVGLSDQTNAAGAQAVGKTFPEYAVAPVKIPPGYHLKDLVCMGGREIMIHGSSDTAKKVMAQIKSVASHNYNTICVEDDYAANCIFINGTLIHLGDNIISRKTYGTLENRVDYPRIAFDAEELLKGDSSLTRLAVLVGKTKHPKKLMSTLD